jgi:membrane associated rhomboid family serine protease
MSLADRIVIMSEGTDRADRHADGAVWAEPGQRLRGRVHRRTPNECLSLSHLMSNTPPLLLMGGLLVATATRALVAVNVVIVALGGALVWVFGSFGFHIGASGLVFGWFGFLCARGLVDRSPVTLGAALLVGAIYGSLIWGVFPGTPGVSWEAHLFGAIAGVIAAIVIPTNVHRPRVRNVERR